MRRPGPLDALGPRAEAVGSPRFRGGTPAADTASHAAPRDVADALAAWEALPVGRSEGLARGRRWIAVRTVRAGGRAEALVAEEPGGTGYVSCNLQRLASGPRLRPCEMALERVTGFLAAYRPRTPRGDAPDRAE